MDKKKESDIDKLLDKMREENLQYRESGGNKGLEILEDEEDIVIESRYHDSKKQEKREIPGEMMETKGKKKKKKKNKVDKIQEKAELPEKKTKKLKNRPKTAKPINKHLLSTKKLKKIDKLTLFLNRQQEWQSDGFLKTNKLNTREGRKLDLISRLKQRPFEVSKKKANLYEPNNYVPVHEKRRDDLRFTTRIKMLSF